MIKRPAARREKDGTIVLRLAQQLDRSRVRSVWAEAMRLLKDGLPSRLVVNLGAASRIDGAGVALLRELEDRCRRKGIEFSVEGATPAVSAFLEFVRARSPVEPGEPTAGRLAGPAPRSRQAASWARSLRELLELVGRFAESSIFLATHPHELRAREVIYQIQKTGADGMVLIAGISVLLGIIMAFQGLSGAQGFGSPIVIADIVTISTTREMAPLLTGIIVTGRSGAAIAAEIGTMKLDEEVDALSIMGFDLMRFLLVPRILALLVSTPLLTLLSIGAGILGGLAVAVFALDLTAVAYFTEVQHALSGGQIASALAKGATFAILIGVIACFQGLQTQKGAEGVGKQTTAAVVMSILLIIFADAFFSIAAEVYGW